MLPIELAVAELLRALPRVEPEVFAVGSPQLTRFAGEVDLSVIAKTGGLLAAEGGDLFGVEAVPKVVAGSTAEDDGLHGGLLEFDEAGNLLLGLGCESLLLFPSPHQPLLVGHVQRKTVGCQVLFADGVVIGPDFLRLLFPILHEQGGTSHRHVLDVFDVLDAGEDIHIHGNDVFLLALGQGGLHGISLRYDSISHIY